MSQDYRKGLKRRSELIKNTIGFLETMEIAGDLAESLADCIRFQKKLLEQNKSFIKNYNKELKSVDKPSKK